MVEEGLLQAKLVVKRIVGYSLCNAETVHVTLVMCVELVNMA